jgi:uncharacterized protein YfkK (UPF0435 family)
VTSRDFCYWLQGYFEIGQSDKNKGAESLSYQQVECIRNHLNMVFKHEIDPSHGDAAHQKALSDIHKAIVQPLGKFDPTSLINC